MYNPEVSHYPWLMINFASIAYDAPDQITNVIKNKTNNVWNVRWGPVALYSGLGVIYSLMYAAVERVTGSYAVIIRGTTMDSLEAWCDEDFRIKQQLPYNAFDPQAPGDALIARGTHDGLKDLLSMQDQKRGGISLLDFLLNVRPPKVYVAGHSLGGTLTGPMALLLQSRLQAVQPSTVVQPYSYAGLTPGNQAFASYFDARFNTAGAWRFHNTLDIAPYLWNNKQAVFDIYNPWGVGIPTAIRDGLNYLTDGAPPYAQLNGNGYPLPGKWETLDIFTWEREAAHQHASTTYIKLVGDNAMPDPQPEGSWARQMWNANLPDEDC
ncbi:MAG: hypothetical protein R3F46_13485 [bacterium]